MKEATLYDEPTGKRSFLFDILKENQRITIGKGDNAGIKLGVDSNKSNLSNVSDIHAAISYDPEKDEFVLHNTSPENGSWIKRGLKHIEINRYEPLLVLKSGDQISFADEINKAYGPVMFCRWDEGEAPPRD